MTALADDWAHDGTDALSLLDRALSDTPRIATEVIRGTRALRDSDRTAIDERLIELLGTDVAGEVADATIDTLGRRLDRLAPGLEARFRAALAPWRERAETRDRVIFLDRSSSLRYRRGASRTRAHRGYQRRRRDSNPW